MANHLTNGQEEPVSVTVTFTGVHDNTAFRQLFKEALDAFARQSEVAPTRISLTWNVVPRRQPIGVVD